MMPDMRNDVVLVVDDVTDNLRVMEMVLRHYGAQVIKAASAEQGIHILGQIMPTLILMDIRMPGMDGWAMFDHVRRMPWRTRIPIIAVTASAQDRDRLIAIGFDGFITKPFDVKTLIREIERVAHKNTAVAQGTG